MHIHDTCAYLFISVIKKYLINIIYFNSLPFFPSSSSILLNSLIAYHMLSQLFVSCNIFLCNMPLLHALVDMPACYIFNLMLPMPSSLFEWLHNFWTKEVVSETNQLAYCNCNYYILFHLIFFGYRTHLVGRTHIYQVAITHWRLFVWRINYIN